MQDDGELAGDSDDRAVQHAPLGADHAPGFQRDQRWSRVSQPNAACTRALRAAPSLDLVIACCGRSPGGVFTRCQAKMRADFPGVLRKSIGRPRVWLGLREIWSSSCAPRVGRLDTNLDQVTDPNL